MTSGWGLNRYGNAQGREIEDESSHGGRGRKRFRDPDDEDYGEDEEEEESEERASKVGGGREVAGAGSRRVFGGAAGKEYVRQGGELGGPSI